jgi:autophagy-related protein 17
MSLSPRSSPSDSPSRSIPPPNLDDLVSYLLASKRSLSSITSVWRANEIVTSARSALEESVILGSRTAFIHAGIADSTSILRKIRQGVQDVYDDGEADFQDTIHTLDAADAQLKQTMDVLRSTMVEASFQPPDTEPKNLLDFVDTQQVDICHTALKEAIDITQVGSHSPNNPPSAHQLGCQTRLSQHHSRL